VIVQPVVTVIIPTYNTEAYVAKAIQSALDQTLQNIEIIVMDDSSADGSVAVAQTFQDERLKVVVNERNLGATTSSNRALEMAQGEWIAILDSDDWMAPERLERMVQVGRAENADLIVDDPYLIRDGEAAPWSTLLGESDRVIREIQHINPVFFVETDVYGKRSLRLGITKPLFRREFLNQHEIRYDPTLKAAYDFWIDMECFVHGANFVLLPESYYYYRARAGSAVMSKRLGWLDDCCRATQNFMQRPITQQNPALVEALAKKLKQFERIRAYYRVVEPLKQKQYAEAFIAAFRHPYFFVHSLMQFPSVIHRRIQYYFVGNKAAYEIFAPTKKVSSIFSRSA
jgi:succinoglycan biosynthesis protein ExoO